ncbi:MAG: Cof-type HAD-IIB family hydrolase [Chloroflexota bacterium]|nr:Cof-type HAD-IIB family hydrolase [Chloroflexota bacterium]
MIRLLALDLDGTLVDDDMVISPRVRRAIAAAQERGVVVTLATGRMFDATLAFARDLGIVAPLICYQGALVRVPDSDTPLHWVTMEPVLVREMLEWQAQRGWHVVLYADDAVFVAEPRYPETFYHTWLGKKLVWVDNLLSVLEQHEPVKFLVVAEPPEADCIEMELRQRFEGRMEIVRSHAMFAEGNPLGVSKGDALQRLAAHLDIPRAQVMAIGDQDNDVTMITWAGVGVAMGNGSPAAKAVADWVAPPLAEDGAAVAIERLALTPQ